MKNSILFSLMFACTCGLAGAQGVKISNTGTQPDASAQLEVESTNKGILIPQVDLQNATDGVTIASPASSLLVFNTGNTLSPSGYYYNGGTPQSPQWILVFTSPAQDTLDMGTNPVVNVPLPVNPNDAVNKDYVDNALLANGGGGGFYATPTMFSTPSGNSMYYIGALEYCRNLTEGGHTDWRIPSCEEFEFLVQDGSVVLPTLNTSTYYWLDCESPYSTSSSESAMYKFTVYFTGSWAASYFAQYNNASSAPRAVCVR